MIFRAPSKRTISAIHSTIVTTEEQALKWVLSVCCEKRITPEERLAIIGIGISGFLDEVDGA